MLVMVIINNRYVINWYRIRDMDHTYTLISQWYASLATQLANYVYSHVASQLYSYVVSSLRIQLYTQLAVQLRSQLAIQIATYLLQLASQLARYIATQLASCIATQLASCIQLRTITSDKSHSLFVTITKKVSESIIQLRSQLASQARHYLQLANAITKVQLLC